MKINEIIYENILDKLLGRNPQDRERGMNAQAMVGASKIAARAWGKYKQNLERINNYNPVPDALLNKKLIEWIDNNLLGSYSLANGGNVLNGVVTRMVQNIMRDPKQTEESFKQILIVTGKVALDPTADDPGGGGFDPSRQDICRNEPTMVKGDTIYVCNKPITPKDPGYKELAVKLGIKQ